MTEVRLSVTLSIDTIRFVCCRTFPSTHIINQIAESFSSANNKILTTNVRKRSTNQVYDFSCLKEKRTFFF